MKTTKTKSKTLNIEQALKAANDGQNQRIKDKFVSQHVFCNVNSLAEYCLNKGFEDSESPIKLDDIENYYSYPEWRETVLGEHLYFEGGNEAAKNTFLEEFARLIEESEELLAEEKISEETHERNIELVESSKSDFENIETEPAEIFEWWAISSYLFDKLKEMGYCVVDAGGCCVWGRTTTGQAILLDYAISKVCADMEILEGQANSWARKN